MSLVTVQRLIISFNIIIQMGNISSLCNDLCKKQQPPHQKLAQSYPFLEIFKRHKAITVVHDMSFPLSTDGACIVDSFNRRVKICAYNLKGCDTLKHCVALLENKQMDQIGKEIRQIGFNTIVIPFSLDFYFENRKVEAGWLGNNDWMKGKRSLDVLDITINSLTRAGLLVILRNTNPRTPHSRESTLSSSSLWWNDKYPESKWIDCLRNMTSRYAHNPRVVAIELFHDVLGGTYGDGNVLTDWRKAVTNLGNEILDLNPNINIIVTNNANGDLRNIAQSPVQLKEKNKVIYAGKIKSFQYKASNVAQFRNYFEQNLNCIRNAGYPLLINGLNDENQPKWKCIIDFLEETDIDWVYSSYNVNRAMETIFGNERIVEDLNRVFESTAEGTDQAIDDYQEIDNDNVYPLSIQPAPRPIEKDEGSRQLIYRQKRQQVQ